MTGETAPGRLFARILLGVAVAVVPSALLIWIVRSPPPPPEAVADELPAAVSPAPRMDAARPMMPRAAVPGGADVGVTARVSLAVSAADWPASARVFVFARRPGERMPLAVERYQLDELPVSLTFSMPEGGGPLELVARLSRSGKVTFDAGDLEAGAVVDPESGVAVDLVLAPRGG